MSLYGAAGFPLMDGIPRGEAFVDFMRSRTGSSAPSATSSPSSSRNVVPTPGGFNDDAQSTTVSEKHTPMPGGVTRTDRVKQFEDGSRRTEVLHKNPDGSTDISTERRSLPDADGFEKVRVWERGTNADGTKRGSFRLFIVPAGMKMDWNSAGAQQYLVESSQREMAADGTIIMPDLSAGVPDMAADVPEGQRDDAVTSPNRSPSIPLPV